MLKDAKLPEKLSELLSCIPRMDKMSVAEECKDPNSNRRRRHIEA